MRVPTQYHSGTTSWYNAQSAPYGRNPQGTTNNGVATPVTNWVEANGNIIWTYLTESETFQLRATPTTVPLSINGTFTNNGDLSYSVVGSNNVISINSITLGPNSIYNINQVYWNKGIVRGYSTNYNKMDLQLSYTANEVSFPPNSQLEERQILSYLGIGASYDPRAEVNMSIPLPNIGGYQVIGRNPYPFRVQPSRYESYLTINVDENEEITSIPISIIIDADSFDPPEVGTSVTVSAGCEIKVESTEYEPPYSATASSRLAHLRVRNVRILSYSAGVTTATLQSGTTSPDVTVYVETEEPNTDFSINIGYQYPSTTDGYYEYKIRLNGRTPPNRRYIRLNGTLVSAR